MVLFFFACCWWWCFYFAFSSYQGLIFILFYFFLEGGGWEAEKGIQGQFIRSQFSSLKSNMAAVIAEWLLFSLTDFRGFKVRGLLRRILLPWRIWNGLICIQHFLYCVISLNGQLPTRLSLFPWPSIFSTHGYGRICYSCFLKCFWGVYWENNKWSMHHIFPLFGTILGVCKWHPRLMLPSRFFGDWMTLIF